MKPIAIDFAPRTTWKRPLFMGCLAFGALLFVASILQYFSAEAAVNRAEAAYQAASANAKRRAAAPMPTNDVTVPAAQIRSINAAINKLNLPWTELFAILEQTKPAQVALLSIEPDPKKRSLVILAESKTPADMLDFAERFRATSLFHESFLTKHEMREQDPNKPYRFSIELRWSDQVGSDVSP